MFSVTNIWMYRHMHDDIKMEGHLMNNFSLHNELPISQRLAINRGKAKNSVKMVCVMNRRMYGHMFAKQKR